MLARVGPDDPRLPHGYTNHTLRIAGGRVVEKRYEGADAAARLACEVECLRLVGHLVPVPEVLQVDHTARTIRTAWVEGIQGQDLIDSGGAVSVLTAAGSMLKTFQIDGGRVLRPVLAGDGTVAVHGDYGPQNLLTDEQGQIVAVLDWEFAHMGEPIEDLSWTEWIVRMHHPERVDALDALFAGYGARPSWPDRHDEMVLHCEIARRRCETERLAAAERVWRDRIRTTMQWSD